MDLKTDPTVADEKGRDGEQLILIERQEHTPLRVQTTASGMR